MSIEYINFKFGELPRGKQVELFEARLDGEVIQCFCYSKGVWLDIKNPAWLGCAQYRVKPKLKTFGELTKEEQKELLYESHYGRIEYLRTLTGEWLLKERGSKINDNSIYRARK